MNKAALTKLIDQLVDLGEDRDELEYWNQIYDYLSTESQDALVLNLEQELQVLQNQQKFNHPKS
jgi:hypothetical protein